MSTNAIPIEEQVWNTLQEIYDPEIPVNIVDLGLIYAVDVKKNDEKTNFIKITMTLTNPACVMGPMIAEMIKCKIKEIPKVAEVIVDIVWEPSWNKDMISERGRMELGWM